jgi:hypothetical protein
MIRSYLIISDEGLVDGLRPYHDDREDREDREEDARKMCSRRFGARCLRRAKRGLNAGLMAGEASSASV